ncbi:glycosyltransferase [Deinococcus apachensis]|uniref:glycosyltransferase n=1 Tax=Deinococcus apachensis TaxID=309886 RepID=UPI0003A632DD|nr:glycosyltransferase family 2 protein [Deinococcus apachensis]
MSVIVPAWNDADALEGIFPALSAALTEYPGEVQLLLVAGGQDGTFERAQGLLRSPPAPNVRGAVLPQTARGKNAALNLGVQAAHHDLLVFLDADTTVEPGWLPALVRPLVGERAEATTGRFSAYTPTPVSGLFEVDQLAGQVLDGRVTLFGGGSIALSRAALDRVGGALPEDVPVGVDWDLSERLGQAGARFAFCEGARVRTEIAQTWPEYWRGEVRWRRAYLRGQMRHLRRDRRPGRLLGLLYVPLVQAAVLLGWLAFPTAARVARRPARSGLLAWGLFAGWVLGRHATTCLRVYAYTRDPRWLRLTPTYLLSFVVSAAASWSAILSLGRVSAHFKGQRRRRTEP